MQRTLLDLRMPVLASFILSTAMVVGTLGRELQARAAEGDLEPQAVSWYKFPGDGDAILIPVVVAGQSYSFILDTGSRITLLDRSFRRLFDKPVDVKTARSSTGDMTLELFSAPSIKIKGINRFLPAGIPKLVTIADLGEVREWSGHDIAGVLGMDVLQYTTICIDPDEQRVSFLDAVPDGAGAVTPLRYWPGKLPAIEMFAGGERVEALVDTGSLGAVEGALDDNTFAQLARIGAITDEQTERFVTLTGECETRSGMLRRLSIGRFVHHDLYFDSSELSSIGMLYLNRYIATFDFPNGRLYLKKSQRHAEPCREDLSGMIFKRVGKRTVMDAVDAGSPAEATGLQTGDVILRIDSMDGASERLHALRMALCAEGSVNLIVERGKTEIPVKLNLVKRNKTTR